MVPNLLTSDLLGDTGMLKGPESSCDFTASLLSSQALDLVLFFVIVVVMYEI
jgi:hypothetical protein